MFKLNSDKEEVVLRLLGYVAKVKDGFAHVRLEDKSDRVLRKKIPTWILSQFGLGIGSVFAYDIVWNRGLIYSRLVTVALSDTDAIWAMM